MPKKILFALSLVGILAVGTAAIASAAQTTIRAGNLVLTFGGNVQPKKLPKRNFAPVALNVFGRIATTDGTHPSAFRETTVLIDRNGRIDARGAPVCRAGQLQSRTTAAARRVCGRAQVGGGVANVQISFPEQSPIPVRSPLSIFNGGTRGNTTTMFIHSFITIPVPAAIVTTLKIQKVRQGRFGYRVVASVPRIAGGSGSVLNYRFTVAKKFFRFRGKRHPYLSARCPDGRFQAKVLNARFRNEANEPGVAAQTVLRGGLVVPCTRGR